MTPTEILRQLVAIPSVSALSNLPLLDFVTGFLEPHGWTTIRQPYTDANGIAKANLLAIPTQFAATLPAVDLLFVCHTDTVPYQPGWPATELQQHGDHLHACGSCDVKGSLAGLLAAALTIDTGTLQTPVAFALTADEEIGCIGATRLVASGLIHPRRVIVCEPTSLRPATAGKGYGLAEVRVRGHEAHSAFPAKGVSAIAVAARVIVALEDLAQSSNRPQDPRFNPPRATFNVGVLHGGTAKNIIAGECTFLVEWRPLPQQDPVAGGRLLQQLAARIASQSSCAIEVTILRADPGFANPACSTLGPTLSRILQQPETGISFGSEATRLNAIAEEVVVIGPGDMETAHSDRECISIAELDTWTATVHHLLRNPLA
jgi:acetylornithine deacetylase